MSAQNSRSRADAVGVAAIRPAPNAFDPGLMMFSACVDLI